MGAILKWVDDFFKNIHWILLATFVLVIIYTIWRKKRRGKKYSVDWEKPIEDDQDIADIIISSTKQPSKKRKGFGGAESGGDDAKSGGGRKKVVYKSEERCREVFQKHFKKPFKSTRKLEWLKNPVTGKNLELDGYNPDIKTPIGKGLAFEYDGQQHAKYMPKSFHKKGGEDEFKYQLAKDKYKTTICKKQGVLLIRIPHFVVYSDLERYILQKLKKYDL